MSMARDMLKETVKQWENDFIRFGIAQGLEQGLEQGLKQVRLQERAAIFFELVTERFGTPVPEVYQKLENASPEELKAWTLKILTAHSPDDIFKH